MEKTIVTVVCPNCKEETKAVAYDGEVRKGICTVTHQLVEPLIVLEN
jgi:hypothetical protein